MNPPSRPDADPRQRVSDLTDGWADAAALGRACADWVADEDARRTWHAYHLIGDVLRSDELARPPRHDRAFLIGLRARLRQEPAPLAPRAAAAGPLFQPLQPSRAAPVGVSRPGLRWRRPMALAAGFVAVAGVLVVLRAPSPELGGLYAVQSPVGVAGPASSAALLLPPQAEMLRDARVDEYLRAHREALAGSPAALPGGAMRSVGFGEAAAR
ncbi:MAG: sigma-E factor negative regulatory protein [Rubrivivax sp.]